MVTAAPEAEAVSRARRTPVLWSGRWPAVCGPPRVLPQRLCASACPRNCPVLSEIHALFIPIIPDIKIGNQSEQVRGCAREPDSFWDRRKHRAAEAVPFAGCRQPATVRTRGQVSAWLGRRPQPQEQRSPSWFQDSLELRNLVCTGESLHHRS